MMKTVISMCVVLALAVLADSAAVKPQIPNVVLADSAAVEPQSSPVVLADSAAVELPISPVALADITAVERQSSRSNLNIGYIRPGDRLLYSRYVYQPPRVNAIQYQDITYTGSRNTRISAVRATEVGYTQFARAWVTRGGVGYNQVTLRVQSARGYGYYYYVEIWGR